MLFSISVNCNKPVWTVTASLQTKTHLIDLGTSSLDVCWTEVVVMMCANICCLPESLVMRLSRVLAFRGKKVKRFQNLSLFVYALLTLMLYEEQVIGYFGLKHFESV